jgi:hypothetical protein
MAARQEVFNAHLSSLLSRLGFPSQAEIKQSYAPDLIIAHPYMGTLLGEAEIGEVWNDKAAQNKLDARSSERFEQPQFAYIDFVVLIVYPRELIQQASVKSGDAIEEALANGEVGFGLAFRKNPVEKGYTLRWYDGPIAVTQIPSTLEEMAKDVVGLTSEQVTRDLMETIEEAGRSLPHLKNMKKTFLAKAQQLDIDPEFFSKEEDCANLTVKTMFILGGIALLIYELARVRYPIELEDLSPLSVSKLLTGLKRLRHINYEEVIKATIIAWSDLSNHPQLDQFLKALYAQVKNGTDIIRRGGWDVLAFMYQRLLSETYRKAYATFYTQLSSAYLLANLAIESEGDKVIDPACGTGSLLVSAFFIKKRYALTSKTVSNLLSQTLPEPLLDHVNKVLLGDMYGIDALKTAVALSSSSLTLASLAIPRGSLKILHAPVGTDKAGSLDLLRMAVIKSDHGGITLNTKSEESYERLGSSFDVVIMNPPFTRSDRIPNLIGDQARGELSRQKLRFGKTKTSNLFVAGLAKPFLVLADRLCKHDGRIALVLPNSVLSRDGWADIRHGIVGTYFIEYIVISYAEGAPNFSSDTQFREILLVLKKRRGEKESGTCIVNLFLPIEGLKLHEIDALAHGIRKRSSAVVLHRGNMAVAANTRWFSWERVKSSVDNWYRLVAFKNLELTEHHLNVMTYCVPLTTYFSIGSEVDHSGGFEVLPNAPTGTYYDAVWGSGRKIGFKSMRGAPHSFIVVTSKRDVKCKFWQESYASKLMLLRRGQLDTQFPLIFELNRTAVSNVWWPLHPAKTVKEEHVAAIMVFLNSIFGLVHLLGERLETRGLWMEFKKGQLTNLPLPAVENLSLTRLREIFRENDLANVERAPLTRIREYLLKMSELETKVGGFEEAVKEGLNDPATKPRAALDKIALEMLGLLGCKSFPQNMYHLVFDEIETLRKIMERSLDNTDTYADRGTAVLRRTVDKSQRRLDKWTEQA